jgi:hypothetical protein
VTGTNKAPQPLHIAPSGGATLKLAYGAGGNEFFPRETRLQTPQDFSIVFHGVAIAAYRNKPVTETVKIWVEHTDQLIAHFGFQVDLVSTGADTIEPSVSIVDPVNP